MYPLLSQLGHVYTWIIFFPRFLIIHSECSGLISSSNSARALIGGTNGSPAKLYLIISIITFYKPCALSRSDYFKSDLIQLRNILYNGFVLSIYPNCCVNISHHDMVDTPSKFGSIDELIFCTNFVQNLGCSFKLLKKRNTAF